MKKNSFAFEWILALSILIVSCTLALRFGSVFDADPEIIYQLRLPRVLLAIAVGMGLSVAGACLQALFSNPLCEPYTLGISSGAALGAVIGTTLGGFWVFSGLAITAFIGALVFTAILYFVSIRPGNSALTLLLSGVMMGFFGSGLVALWMALADSNGIQSAVLWLLGDLSRARMGGACVTLLFSLLFSVILWLRSKQLDVLLMGEEDARSLGIEVSHLRRRVIFVVSLLVSFCVSASGMIGFLGLLVPHLVRRRVGALHGKMLPLCAVWGATLLVIADMLARISVRPFELPVGVVTALVGAPVFLWILLKREASV
ncbi:iron ABC transporter permease [Bdellovibrionota bacterium FG-2]